MWRHSVILFLLSGCWIAVAAETGESRCIIPDDLGGNHPTLEQVAGHYSAVSESEWNLEVWLKPNGDAEVLRESWLAGEFESRTSVLYRGKWSLFGAFVALEFGGRCETLFFDPALSFAEFGRQGAAPGLQGRHSPISNAILLGVSLWRTKDLEAIPAPG